MHNYEAIMLNFGAKDKTLHSPLPWDIAMASGGSSQTSESNVARPLEGGLADLFPAFENVRRPQALDLAWVREIRNVLLGAVGIFVAYKYGVSGSPKLLSALWLPDSVLLCCLLFTPVRRWWLYILIALPVRLHFATQIGIPPWQALANYPNDIVKALFSATLLRVFSRGRFRLDSLYHFRLFFIVAVVAAPALSAFGGASVRHLGGEPFWQNWYRWFLSCALAALVVTPSLVYWITAPAQALRSTARRYGEAFLLSLGVLLTSYFAFARSANNASSNASSNIVLLYAPIPFLIWAAARFGPLAASTAISVVGVLAMLSSRHGLGPFVVSSSAENIVAMQLFLVVITVPLLLLSILITERRRTEHSLRQTMQDLARSREDLRENYDHIQNLSSKLLSLHDEERKAISRELHNGVSQQITEVLLALTVLRRHAGVPERARNDLDTVLSLLSQVSDGIRNLSRQLHPTVVESMGLPRALQSLCGDSKLLVEFRGCELPAELSSNAALAIYYIAQEAVRNASYHSRSKRASIELSSANHGLQLRVRDWGCGFDVERARRKGGLGLISMQDRAESVDGNLKINSRSGHGTEIVVEIPVQSSRLSTASSQGEAIVE